MPTTLAPYLPHTINIDDMLEYIEHEGSHWLTYASDGWKRIEFRHAGGYRVRVQGTITYEGTDGSTAVRHYNDAKRG